MKNSSLIIAILVFLFLGSCIPSLFPLYFEKDLITNDNLVGSWKDDASSDTWVFNQHTYKNEKRKSYTLRYLEKSNNTTPGVLGIFDIHLFN
ncbi:MAG: hypothetical protein J7L04_13675, partial [Bacteroidales bacterium]|nr:hypothetical protein [Bacteroidales bacterium]